MAEHLANLITATGNDSDRILNATGLIAKNLNAQGQSTSWAGHGLATVVLHPDHTCTIYFQYTITSNDDSAAGYQFGISASALRTANPNIPVITPRTDQRSPVIIVNPDGTIRPETSTSGTSATANGYSGYTAGSASFPGIWITGRVYKTDGSTGTWSSTSVAKFSRIFGVALGTW